MIKLVAIDLDGTLLNEQKLISDENKQALAQAKQQGVKIVLCTGRPLAAMAHYLQELGLVDEGDYSITFNGGLVQKNDTGEIMEKKVMEVSDIQRLYKLAQQLDLPLDVLSDNVVLQLPSAPRKQSLYNVLNKLLQFQPADISDITDEFVLNKAVIAYDQEELDPKIKEIPVEFHEMYEIIKTRSMLLEFMPKGVTKAYGISLLAKDLGLKQEEIMAIGDEENDLPMIQYAGLGVAMENAVPFVKEAADFVTVSNEENGVAKVNPKICIRLGESQMGFFDKIKRAFTGEEKTEEVEVQEKYDKGLEKTRKTFGERMNELFANFRTVDEDFFEELEETLIGADVGFETAIRITEALRQEVKLRNAKKSAEVQNAIIEKLVDLYEAEGINEVNELNIQEDGLTVILFVGVNGVGKTTSIGKLAHQFKNEGKKVLMAAADTFRAGAIDQLVVWGERAGVEVVRGNAGGDPAAVVFDALERAKTEQADVLLVDTAGRLQNKVNLMNELEKIKRVIQRELPEAPQETLLVLDATTGQNAMVQAKQFKETTDVTGLVLTKLDGTAKGGIVLAIRNELHLPVKLVGLGEGIDDLEPFDPNDFVVGLFKGLLKEE